MSVPSITSFVVSGNLYVPRGWWHVATPLAEASLHLTFGINNRTGLDFLNWLGERLHSATVYRAYVPKSSREETHRAHCAKLKAALNDMLTGDLIAEFLEDTDAKARVSIRLGLPWSVEECALAPNDCFRLRF